jgi:5-hydroxyisourate hydrolase
MGHLTTHVLDTASGVPGDGIGITLYRVGASREKVAQWVTNRDGRTDVPLLDEGAFRTGCYEIVFHVGPYFAALGIADSQSAFLGDVVIRVNLADDAHYHVPLLTTPWSYSTYRGS